MRAPLFLAIVAGSGCAGSLDPTTDDSGSNHDQDLLTAIEAFDRGTRPHVADTDDDGDSGTDPLGWARHTIVVMDITNSWSLDSFLAARDGALALFDEHVATGRGGDRIGLVVFFGRFGIEYTPSMQLDEAVSSGVRSEWELLRPASIGCPGSDKCAPWMPHQYPDETGTDHAMGLRMARTMFSEHAGPGVYRTLVMITDGQPSNVAPHLARWQADDDETRWRYEYADAAPTVSEIKADSVAISSALWHDHQVHGWWVSFRQDRQFMRDAVRGDGAFLRAAEASEIADLLRDVAIAIP